MLVDRAVVLSARRPAARGRRRRRSFETRASAGMRSRIGSARAGFGDVTGACTSSGRWRHRTAARWRPSSRSATGALLSHDAAAALWGLRPPQKGPIDVTVPGRETRSRHGIRIPPQPASTPATRPASTASRSPARHEPCSTSPPPSRNATWTAPSSRPRCSARSHCIPSMSSSSATPTHRGTAALSQAIRTDPKLTRSKLERRMLELIRAARLPMPSTNTKVCDWEVDLVWHAAPPRRRARQLHLPLIAQLRSSVIAARIRSSRRRAGVSSASPGGRSPTSRRP